MDAPPPDLQPTDYAVREWSGVSPKLRDDLRFRYHDDKGEAVYVVEDLVNRKYHQLGIPEYRFARSLDGKKTVSQLAAQSISESNRSGMSEQEVSSLLRWMLDVGLLDTSGVNQAGRRSQLTEDQDEKKPKNPIAKVLFVKIPVGNPDAFLAQLTRWFSWIFSPFAFLVWSLVVAAGIVATVIHGGAILQTGAQAILPGNQLYLVGVFVLLKIVHELAHGIATKRYGGTVPEWGVQLIAWVTPLTYVDATSSWSFPSKYRRMMVAFAGIYIELFLAAIAVFVWLESDSPGARTLASNVFVSASLVTLLFNANPLMRFDGYYILSDAIGIRNLATKGQQLMKWFGKRWILGIQGEPPSGTKRHFKGIFLYGLLALLWRIIISIGIMAIVASLFKGAGVVVVALMLVLGLYAKIVGYVKTVREHRSQRAGILLRTALLVGILVAGLLYIPVSPAPKAVAVVTYETAETVRAECPGFLKEIHVDDGDLVEKGQLLATASNLDEAALLARAKIDLQRSGLQAKRYLARGQQAAYAAESEVLESLRERVAAQGARLQTLEFRAPREGRIHAPNLDGKLGEFLSTGVALLDVVPAGDFTPKLKVSVPQKDADHLQSGDRIRIRLNGSAAEFPAIITNTQTRADTTLWHPALASTTGGPLTVQAADGGLGLREIGAAREVSEAETHRNFGGRRENSLTMQQELATARVSATAVPLIDPIHQLLLREGQWASARLEKRAPEALGSWLYGKVVGYLEKQFRSSKF